MPKPPHIVLFRHAPIDIDSRVKKLALTLNRAGYRATVISTETPTDQRAEASLSGVRVLRIPPNPPAGVKAVTPSKSLPARALRKVGRLASKVKQRVADRLPQQPLPQTADPLDDLPAAKGMHEALLPELVALEPDVLHCHHPWLLETTFAAKSELSRRGIKAKVHYDARENFAGLPENEIGPVAAHRALLELERRYVPQCDSVSTVSQPIAEILQDRFGLVDEPSVFLNMPVDEPFEPSGKLRKACGIGDEVRLLVYSGTMSRGRRLEVMVDGLALLPEDVHLAMVCVPFPHPLEDELRMQALDKGCLSRLHFVAPVNQSELSGYLAGADIAVSPISGRSPNHNDCLPNKLFEYLGAGIPLVVSNAKLMADFVASKHVGRAYDDTPEGFAEAVLAEFTDPTDVSKVVEVASEYTWQRSEANIVAHYNRLTGFDGEVSSEPFPSLKVSSE